MRVLTSVFAGLLLCFLPAEAQSSECASVSRSDKEVILTTDSWDPVLAIGATLADRYGINVSVESPKWDFPRDTEDVAIADPQFSAQHHNVHYLLMKRHVIEIRFPTVDDLPPSDAPGLLRRVAEDANKEMPYSYRLDIRDDEYVFVPTQTRNSAGEVEDVQPLLDRYVRIPAATRPIAEHARLMAYQLSEQTGLHISCCQTLAAGVPWGLAEVPFQTDNEPAREVLRELIRLELKENSQAPNRHPPYDRWTVRCDGTGAPWCSIEVQGRLTHRCQ